MNAHYLQKANTVARKTAPASAGAEASAEGVQVAAISQITFAHPTDDTASVQTTLCGTYVGSAVTSTGALAVMECRIPWAHLVIGGEGRYSDIVGGGA